MTKFFRVLVQSLLLATGMAGALGAGSARGR